MNRYPEKLQELVDTLALVEDRQEKIQLLIDIAERYRPVPETIARKPYPETNKVPACESEAYVFTEKRPDGSLDFHFAVLNPQGISAMAMAVILDDTLSGVPPAEVAKVPGDLIYEIFGNELSMGKSMGLMGMVGMVAMTAKKLAKT